MPEDDETIRNDEQPTRIAGSEVTQASSAGGANLIFSSEASAEFVGQYKILRKIGQGGMGAVYEAEQDNPRRVVALKVIRPGIATPSLIRRFALEAQVLGRLQHPGIAQIFEAGAANTGSGPQPFFAMEYVRGGGLMEHIASEGLGIRKRLELMAKVCDAVHYAHQQGIIHRDLKPANILVDQSGQPKILDFGVARATDSDIQATTMQTDVGQLVGTLAYMSPEQVAADPAQLDTRSDVYALGIILYETLTDSLPYPVSGKSLPEIVRMIREDDPTPLSTLNKVFRGDVETIVAKALEKEKNRRYNSAAEIAGDIRRYLNDEPIVARPASAVYQLQKFAKRNRALVLGIAGVFVTLVAGIITSTSMYLTAVSERKNAFDARDKAIKAQKEADENFRMAQKAVDRYLNQITESKELKANGLEDLRRRLLANAKTFYEQFVRQRANDPSLQRDLAAAHLSLGNISRMVGETDEAEKAYKQAMEIARRLGLKNQPTPEDRVQLVNLQGNLGLLYSEIGKFDEAEALLKAAIQQEEALPKTGPSDPEKDARLSNLLNNLGILYETVRKSDLAEGAYTNAIALREKISAAQPKDAEAANTLIASYNNLAKLYATSGRAATVGQILRKAVALAEKVAAENPGEPEYQNSYAASLGNLAGVLILTGKLQEARELYEKALPVREALAAKHPSVLNYRLLLSSGYCNLGELNVRLEKPAESLPWFDKAAGVLNRILEQEPRHTTGRYYLSYTLSWRAKAFEKSGKLREALADWTAAIKLDDHNDPELRAGRDRVAKALGSAP